MAQLRGAGSGRSMKNGLHTVFICGVWFRTRHPEKRGQAEK